MVLMKQNMNLRKPKILGNKKLKEEEREAIGGLGTFILLLCTWSLTNDDDVVNQVAFCAVTSIFLIATMRFRNEANYILSGLGQVFFSGAQILSDHVRSKSNYLLADLMSILAAVSIVFGLGYEITPSSATLCVIISLTLITLLNATLLDQTEIDASDAWIKAALQSPFEKDTSSSSYAFASSDVFLREKTGRSVESRVISESTKKKILTLPEYSWSQIQTHKCEADLWIVANDLVYDISSFYVHHPGGRKVLITMAGRDATDVLEEYHPENVFSILPKYLIGRVSKVEDSSGTSESTSTSNEDDLLEKAAATNDGIIHDYRKVRQILLELGLFETDNDYYFRKFLLSFIAFSAAVYFVVASASIILHMISASFIALVWQQTAFIGHDLGHTSMTHIRKIDFLVGSIIANLLGGISIGWWKLSHNVHHVNCNSMSDDPDIQHMPVFAVDPKMLNGFYSTFHSKLFVFDYAAKLLLSFQHVLFYPIMAFARLNLYLQSILYFISQPLYINKELNYDAEYKLIETTSWFGFLLWHASLLYCLPNWKERIAYFLVSHALSGILHVQICISHFAMKTYEGQFTEEVSAEVAKCARETIQDATIDEHIENWLLLQVNTSMNVKTPVNLDFFHGGLQFQIEHHLFPRLPRHNLRTATRFVQLVCEKHNIVYHSPTFFEANVELVHHLRKNAMNARLKRVVDSRDFRKSEIYEGMNLIG